MSFTARRSRGLRPNLLAMDLMVSPALTVYLRAISGLGVGWMVAVGSGRGVAGGGGSARCRCARSRDRRGGRWHAGAGVTPVSARWSPAAWHVGTARGQRGCRLACDGRVRDRRARRRHQDGHAGQTTTTQDDRQRHHADQHHAATHEHRGYPAPGRAGHATRLGARGSRVDRDGDGADERPEPRRLQPADLDVVLGQGGGALLTRPQVALAAAVRLGQAQFLLRGRGQCRRPAPRPSSDARASARPIARCRPRHAGAGRWCRASVAARRRAGPGLSAIPMSSATAEPAGGWRSAAIEP